MGDAAPGDGPADRSDGALDERGPVPSDVVDPSTAAIFRAFFVRGRLQTMPAKRSKRLVVLDHLARVFEPGVRYPEPEVNTLLKAFHPDYAMVRRSLVDEGFLARDHGIYWRSGGTVDLGPVHLGPVDV